MIKKVHNEESKKFFQKILLFIDTILVNSTSASPDQTDRVLVTGILNIKDALLSEIVRENSIEQLNKILNQPKDKKNEEKSLEQKEESGKDRQG